jgi:hypothetical protein
VSNLRPKIIQSKLEYFKFETRSNEIINKFWSLDIYQLDLILKIQTNLLLGGLISQVCDGRVRDLTNVSTTRHTKGVDAVKKKHKKFLAEG